MDFVAPFMDFNQPPPPLQAPAVVLPLDPSRGVYQVLPGDGSAPLTILPGGPGLIITTPHGSVWSPNWGAEALNSVSSTGPGEIDSLPALPSLEPLE